MNEKELIEGISFPVKHLEVYLNSATAVNIDGSRGDYSDGYSIIDVYDRDKRCNHSKTFYGDDDVYDGETKENIITCINYLKCEKILKDGINYEMYFGDNIKDEPITCNVYNGEIVKMKGVE